MHQVFIDGSAGTTGLRIAQRLGQRSDITVLALPEAQRKDVSQRLAMMAQAQVAFLCLPDAAASEIAAQAPAHVTLLDTSTAHRTAAGWAYGFPELRGRRDALRTAKRIAVPGCHASGFIALAAPLVELGILSADFPFTAHSVTGYSGGGKSMIAAYESDPPSTYSSPRQYGLGQTHKHLPEMQAICGLSAPPVFCPIVANYYSGMAVSIPVHTRMLAGSHTPRQIAEALADYYSNEPVVRVHAFGEAPPDGFLAANTLCGSDAMELYVLGNDDRLVFTALFDNLGKGSSGAAIQCMNLALGEEETKGLVLSHETD